jgi:hypothetical protein
LEGSGCIHVAVDSFRSKLLLRPAGGRVVRRREGEWEREKEREREDRVVLSTWCKFWCIFS